MRRVRKQKERRTFLWGLVAAGAVMLALTVPSVQSVEIEGLSEPIIRVEEDWELVLNEPDGNVDSPQFHTIMSPEDDLYRNYAQVLWNYRETPGFTPGGVQLQSYDDDVILQRRSIEFQKLDTVAETLRWTQALSTDGVILTFEVLNGTSTTWGAFGRDMRLDSSTGLSNLSTYDPAVSVESSCITYGSNRVDSMKITQVRYYGPSGLLHTDSTPRVVFEYEDD